MRPAALVTTTAALLLLGGGAPHARPPRPPGPLGLGLGMSLDAARRHLAGLKARISLHADDKPFRGESVKLRAELPAPAAARRLTLYFVKQRLWQIKLRSLTEGLRRSVEAPLGRPEREAAAVRHGQIAFGQPATCGAGQSPRRLLAGEAFLAAAS